MSKISERESGIFAAGQHPYTDANGNVVPENGLFIPFSNSQAVSGLQFNINDFTVFNPYIHYYQRTDNGKASTIDYISDKEEVKPTRDKYGCDCGI